jgi:hypothetical protein
VDVFGFRGRQRSSLAAVWSKTMNARNHSANADVIAVKP